MSNQIALFSNNAAVPAFARAQDTNELAAYASEAYAMLSIKGKVFSRVMGDDRRVLPREPGSRDPATRINVIILRAGKAPAKRYYEGTFKEGDENTKPCCFSFDGVHPDAGSTNPQCKSCAACRNNAFGTARNQDGSFGKGKACSDYIRLAVCPADPKMYEDIYYLSVPPASIKNFKAFATELNRHKVMMRSVITEISFDPVAATPKLCFEPIGFVSSEAEFAKLNELSESPLVRNIVEGAAKVDATNPVTEEQPVVMVKRPAPAPVATIEAQKEKAVDNILDKAFAKQEAVQPAPAAKPVPVVEDDKSLSDALTNFGF